MADKIFGDGFSFEKPRLGAPDFVKGSININVSKATAFLAQHKSARGWVKLDLKKSKDKGVLYFELDTRKPTTKEDTDEPPL